MFTVHFHAMIYFAAWQWPRYRGKWFSLLMEKRKWKSEAVQRSLNRCDCANEPDEMAWLHAMSADLECIRRIHE